MTWNPKLYDEKCGFVSEYGKEIVSLLAPQRDEWILDLGCGTGVLANELVKLGVHVIGIDSSYEMIQQAKSNYPDLTFKVANGHNFKFKKKFDAVFSNAALHWMLEPQKVIASVWQCLKNNGRFVFEMGGKNNLQQLINAIQSAAVMFGVTDFPFTNYFPKLGEYASLLESQGFRVVYAELIDRPTRLGGDEALESWIYAFRGAILEHIPKMQHETFFEYLKAAAKEHLYYDDSWWADYVRLRVVAFKSSEK